MLGPILLTNHNIHYYQDLTKMAREAIEEDRFNDFADDFINTHLNSTPL